jgi:bifunctional enzyme Fae/Hps
MKRPASTRLSKKNRYLQIAFNSTLEDARAIIAQLPASDRILIEAGTPLLKRYGTNAIRVLHALYRERLFFGEIAEGAKVVSSQKGGFFGALGSLIAESNRQKRFRTQQSIPLRYEPYVIADMKTMDRGRDEVAMAAEAGASAVIALGSAPIETLNAFIDECALREVDAMIDMMNVEYPLAVLSALKRQPKVVILHRGVDEERDNKSKMLPLFDIRRVKGAHDTLISIAGGDTPREVQSAVFNDADIVVVWKSVYENNKETVGLVTDFLKEIK